MRNDRSINVFVALETAEIVLYNVSSYFSPLISKSDPRLLESQLCRFQEILFLIVRYFQSLSVRNEDLSLSGKMEHDVEYNKSESEYNLTYR